MRQQHQQGFKDPDLNDDREQAHWNPSSSSRRYSPAADTDVACNDAFRLQFFIRSQNTDAGVE